MSPGAPGDVLSASVVQGGAVSAEGIPEGWEGWVQGIPWGREGGMSLMGVHRGMVELGLWREHSGGRTCAFGG